MTGRPEYWDAEEIAQGVTRGRSWILEKDIAMVNAGADAIVESYEQRDKRILADLRRRMKSYNRQYKPTHDPGARYLLFLLSFECADIYKMIRTGEVPK